VRGNGVYNSGIRCARTVHPYTLNLTSGSMVLKWPRYRDNEYTDGHRSITLGYKNDRQRWPSKQSMTLRLLRYPEYDCRGCKHSIALGWPVYTKYDFTGSQGIKSMILGCPRYTKYDFRDGQEVQSLTLWWKKYAEYDIRGPKMYIAWRWDDQCMRSITLEAPKVYRVWLWNDQVTVFKVGI
jgi:hypothetical protein